MKEEFKDDLLEQISDPKISDKLSEIAGNVISSSISSNKDTDKDTKLSITDIRGDLLSGYSTFGISIGLALLGTFLAKKYRKSKAARIIAKIFGANVEQMDRSYVLQKLVSDPTYFERVKRGITEILSKGDLQQLTKYFALEFDLREDEALEVYLQIKDVILDSQIIGSLLQISVSIGQIKNKLAEQFDRMRNAASQQLEDIRKNMDTLLTQQITKVEEVFNKSLSEFGLSQANFEIWSKNTMIGEGDKNCWKSGFFSEREIKSNYDVRRPITDTILESIEENFGTMLYGRPYDGKTILLKRIMLEEIQKEEYVVLFCDKVIVNQVHIKNMLAQITQQFPKLLVIIDNAHSSGAEEIYKVYNHFLGLYNNTHSDITNNTKKANADKKAISSSIRFLFAARTEEISQFTNSSLLNIDDKREVEYALSHANGPIEIHFNPEDASRFVQKALEIGNNQDQSLPLSHYIYPQKAIENIANALFDKSNNDPLMFGCYIRSLIYAVGNKKNKNFNVEDIINNISFVNCINEDFREKKIFIDNCNDQQIRKAAIACSVIGSFDIPLSKERLRACCDIYNNHLEKLAEGYFLKKSLDVNNKSYFQIRHPRWAIEFLSYLYKSLENDFEEFNHEYQIVNIFSSILYHIALHDIFNVLKLCVAIFTDVRLKPFSEIIIQNFEVPTTLTDDEKIIVQEQFAFTLNRMEQSERAEKILTELIDSGRGRSETYGILGRVYKDRWKKTLKTENNKTLADEFLEKAIDRYLKGFEINPYDYYPGINAVTLMEIKNPSDEKRKQILPQVRNAVNHQLSLTNKPNYWDYATLIELAVLDKDESKISETIANALNLLPDKWQVESTLGNINIIKEAREVRNELGDIEKMIINKLEAYTNSGYIALVH